MDWSAAATFLSGSDYTIAREVILRGVAAIYFLAFLSTFHQFPVLAGARGLLPVPRFIDRTRAKDYPGLFRLKWFPYSDRKLRILCLIGMALAVSVVAGLPQLGPGWATIPVFLVMWLMYLSIVNLGQRFYGFGWETMLLEAGFIVGFLGSTAVAPPLLILLFLRWLMFRLEFGAGMIKMRGDASWRNLTAMYYHHQTQPMPNPVSRWAHQKPQWWHRGEALGSHIVQLGMPWLLFFPQPIASFAACAIILSQGILVVTGNYAWLNWLTIILAFSGISDSFLRWVGGLFTGGAVWPGWEWETIGRLDAGAGMHGPAWWLILTGVVFLFLLSLSWQPLHNLFWAQRQQMNASFNRFHLVNAYGAFGSMTKDRREFVIEGAMSAAPRPEDWRAYEFRGKPGDPSRMPRQFAPYHLRLDWLMWFAALGAYREVWFSRILDRILEGDPGIRRLLRIDPFYGEAPRLIRVRIFEYRYSTAAEKRMNGDWWVREERGLLVRPQGLRTSRAKRAAEE
ncbi:lipase maturation factor family protein [Gulosibacter molinativorax]|uniref:Lipase maturation factor family protein n=1 Tax=Gulosibacter molinativorax TaxID=256821 RepID=A0ABT7C9E6_9MICO|nr:lipase maturation factor family protein [Gulosibacter molinativorax]MDJ1371728.1 lipase maturation factor family protein [Gulosibacter molinativorax]QUY63150.1 Lipase maturation factor 1 [Gulosibacter molinativorax]